MTLLQSLKSAFLSRKEKSGGGYSDPRQLIKEWEQASTLLQDYVNTVAGRKIPNLMRAIEIFEAARKTLGQYDYSVPWAMTMHNLATAYSVLPIGDKAQNLLRAIECFEEALRFYNERDFPAAWADAMNNLAVAYSKLPTGDQTQNLQLAIEYYRAALRVRTESDFPAGWADTMNNLATAYGFLPTGDRSQNLQQAIVHHQAALRVYTEHSFPVGWARTINNLGNEYWALPTGDRRQNLSKAIECYQAALRVRNEREFPGDWAETMHNLGNAYMDLPTENQTEKLRWAINCYQAALRVRTEQDFPEDWAATMNGLASAYIVLPTEGHDQNVQQAIECYKAALRVYTEEHLPRLWALTNSNLGNAFCELQIGNRVQNLQQAVRHYQAALRVFTIRNHPTDWAMVMNNLATAFWRMGGQPQNLQQAIIHYQESLQVYTEESFPLNCLQTLRNLGDLYFSNPNWSGALEKYHQAVVVIEQIRLSALQESEQRRIFQASSLIFDRAILSAWRTTQPALALTLAERGKTRSLADHLWQREARPHGVSESAWQQYQVQLINARTMERELSPAPAFELGPQSLRERGAVVTTRRRIEDLIALRQSITEMEARFREQDPEYLPFATPLEMQNIAELAAATKAILVEFRVTSEGTYVFLVGPEDQTIAPEQVVELQGFTDATLLQMLARFEGDTPVDGWLVKYDLFRRHKLPLEEWLACVEETTGQLYLQMLAPVRERLRSLYPSASRLILIPNKALNLLPLHTCWWETEAGERRYLLDAYEIAWTPSCQVLKQCLARERANGAPARSLFAVQNPDPEHEKLKLPFSDWEVEEVSKFFAAEQRKVLAGAIATESAVREQISFGAEKLFSCHGLFDLGNIEQSHLKLQGEERLNVLDIVPMNLKNTWLAVLSACETGFTDPHDLVDEYQGLPAAFLVAGAQTVVPSLWSVNDFSTALLMQRFHTNLYLHQMDKAPALREAQRWLRDLTTKEVQSILAAKKRELLGLPSETNAEELQRAFEARKLDLPDLTKQRMDAVNVVDAQFRLKDLSKQAQAKPFANPYWWGAFQCVGAGWQVKG